MVWVAPKDYIASIAGLSQLLSETIYWTDSNTFGMYE